MDITYLFTPEHLKPGSLNSQTLEQVYGLKTSATYNVSSAETPAVRTIALYLRNSPGIECSPHYPPPEMNNERQWVNMKIVADAHFSVYVYLTVGEDNNNDASCITTLTTDEIGPLMEAGRYLNLVIGIDHVTRQVLRSVDGYPLPPLDIPDEVIIDRFLVRPYFNTSSNLHYRHIVCGTVPTGTPLPLPMELHPCDAVVGELPATWSVSDSTKTPTEIVKDAPLSNDEVTPHLITDPFGEVTPVTFTPKEPVDVPLIAWGYRVNASRDGGGVTYLHTAVDGVDDHSVLSIGQLTFNSRTFTGQLDQEALMSKVVSIHTNDSADP